MFTLSTALFDAVAALAITPLKEILMEFHTASKMKLLGMASGISIEGYDRLY
jgi:multisubunit Na+/H+ antiporter MnhG subunit